MQRHLGACLKKDGTCEFTLWAPWIPKLEVEIHSVQQKNIYRLPMQRLKTGYFYAKTKSVVAGDRYYFCGDETRFPDPASTYQPEGIHGPSEIIEQTHAAAWRRISLSKYIIYELHVGTFTEEGTFAAIIPHLAELKELGVTAIEIMPVAQFSGTRNWGYDGVFPFAVQNSYGGPQGLKQLINACHKMKLAVILDVVYNHIGPEGNILPLLAPYFTDKYHTPWGQSLNFDDALNQEVRTYFIENAVYWFTEYGVDALRLDALHAIVDNSAYPFLEELADEIANLSQKTGQKYYLIAESSANDPRLVRSKKEHGFGLHAQWNDEFHHALHSILTTEQFDYYADFGDLHLFLKAYTEGYAYSGQYSIFRQKPHGRSSATLPANRFVVFLQNHDHIGNRPFGDRLTHLLSPMQLKFAAALLFFSPYIPLIFMGEEYAETAPFYYFISHEGKELIEAVRQGRIKEFSSMAQATDLPDPQLENTFTLCKLNHELKSKTWHREIWEFYKKLIHLRKTKPALSHLSKKNMSIKLVDEKLVFITRHTQHQHLLLIANFSHHALHYAPYLDLNSWSCILSSYPYERTHQELPAYGILIFEKECEHE